MHFTQMTHNTFAHYDLEVIVSNIYFALQNCGTNLLNNSEILLASKSINFKCCFNLN